MTQTVASDPHWSAIDLGIAEGHEVSLTICVLGSEFTERFIVDCVADTWLMAHIAGDEHAVIFGEHPDAVLPLTNLSLLLEA